MKQKEENRICQNCKNEFAIESDDFSFYEKIKVPPPTFCPECRSVRRMMGANERVLYKRKCDLTGEPIFSMYDESVPFPVYETKAWYGDDWDPYKYGVEYDFSKSFFEQFLELRNRVPRMSLVKQGFSTNSEYTHRASDMKNSYMTFRATRCEDTLYTYIAKDLVNCMDCFAVDSCELCYECIDCNKCYKTSFSQESVECRDSMFLYSCKNCSNCVGCVNLVNQEYCILNEKYSKQDYFKKLEELKLNTSNGLAGFDKFFDSFRKKFPQRFAMSLKSNKVSGNWFTNCENVRNSFWGSDMKDCKYAYFIFGAEDCMDYFQWGRNSELIYESSNCGINCSRLYFCSQCWTSAHDLYYCDSCPSSSYCFGCVGIKKGQYCILNKQHTKEEYEEMLPKIIKQMSEVPYIDKMGIEYRFGENFPREMFTFSYNETAAIDFYPISKEEVLAMGFKWKDREKKNYQLDIESVDLPETIEEVEDSIINKVIGCKEKDKHYSTGAYRITANELSFYRRMNLPLPKMCFDVRHTKRLQKRPPLQIIERNCSKCTIKLKTVYTENYAPILYCEKCYQQEVY